MGFVSTMIGQGGAGFGYAEHLLGCSWRRLVTGRCSSLTMDEFNAACGEDGPEVFATFCTVLKAVDVASRRQFAIGAPGCHAVTTDERQVLALVADAQAQSPALLEAHLRWIAASQRRHIQIVTGALARALAENALHIGLPAHDIPGEYERPWAVTSGDRHACEASG